MGDFWDNNKDSIKRGALTTGKYAWRGTKVVSKAGYHAMKNSGNSNSKPGTADSEKVEAELGPTRSMEQLQPAQNFPPPPLKPGQMQYSSAKLSHSPAQGGHQGQVQPQGYYGSSTSSIQSVQTPQPMDGNQSGYFQQQQQNGVYYQQSAQPPVQQQAQYSQGSFNQQSVQPQHQQNWNQTPGGQETFQQPLQLQVQYQQQQPQVQYLQQPQTQPLQYQQHPQAQHVQRPQAQPVQYQQQPQYVQQPQQQHVQYQQQQHPVHYQQQPEFQQPQPPQRQDIAVPASQLTVNGSTVNIPSFNVDKQKAMNMSGQLMSHFMNRQEQPEAQDQGTHQLQGQQDQQQQAGQFSHSMGGPVAMIDRESSQRAPQHASQLPLQETSQSQYYQKAQPTQPTQPLSQIQPVVQQISPPVSHPDFQQTIGEALGLPKSQYAPTDGQTLQQHQFNVPHQIGEPHQHQLPAPITSNGSYYNGISQSPQFDQVGTAQPPPPARDYTRTAASVPQPGSQPGSQPGPQMVQPPVQTPIQIPQFPQVPPVLGQVDFSPKPDLAALPLPPRRTIDHPPAGGVTVGPTATGGSVGSTGSIPGHKADVTTGAEGSSEELPAKGISGRYEYKVDVKFAPPPSHRESKVPHTAPLKSAGAQRANPVSAPPRPTPATPLNGSTSNANICFPAPPRPFNPRGDSHNHLHAPPPAYSVEEAIEVPQSSVATPPVMNKFAPPPRPFRKAEPNVSQLTVSEPAMEQHSAPIIPPKRAPPPLKPKPDLSRLGTKKTPPPVKPKPIVLQAVEPKPELDPDEDNPFSRYLQAAVPEEKDRFHRRL